VLTWVAWAAESDSSPRHDRLSCIYINKTLFVLSLVGPGSYALSWLGGMVSGKQCHPSTVTSFVYHFAPVRFSQASERSTQENRLSDCAIRSSNIYTFLRPKWFAVDPFNFYCSMPSFSCLCTANGIAANVLAWFRRIGDVS